MTKKSFLNKNVFLCHNYEFKLGKTKIDSGAYCRPFMYAIVIRMRVSFSKAVKSP